MPTGDRGHLPLTEILINEYTQSHPRKRPPAANLIASWQSSLPGVVEALHRQGLDGVEVIIEYTTPDMAGEADVILAGQHPASGDLSYVVIELKQWRKVTVDPGNPVAVDAGYPVLKLHPVRQVQRYCEFLIQHLAPLRGHRERIAGAALLHNARSEVLELFDLPSSSHGQLFTADRMDLFELFLSARLSTGVSGSRAADVLLGAEVYQPPTSNEAFSRVGSPHPVFALQKEQEIAFQQVLQAVKAHRAPGRPKQVVIIQGSPGSGKTAIAVELLRTLKQEGVQAIHASGSRSFTNNLRTAAVDARVGMNAKAAEMKARQDFRFQQFGHLPENSIHVLICDEAHRVRRKSDGQDVKALARQRGLPQADELINVAEVPVFLLDDWQSLRPDEVGTAVYLSERARALGCEPVVIQLPGMFRAAGSSEYRAWVAQFLGLSVMSPQAWVPDGRIDIRFAESPEELEAFLEERMSAEGTTARTSAGFCWEWKKPEPGEVLFEVRIGDWHKPWNSRDEARAVNYPQSSSWATDPRGFGQIGCIYTAQNFEFDWHGVIIGPDLVWRDGRFVVDRSKTHDPKLTARTVADEDVDRLVRHAYHVLLTRAQQGTVIYSEDEETRTALRRLISGTVADKPFDKRKKQRQLPA